LLLGFYLFYWR